MGTTESVKILLRGDTAYNWESINPILGKNELAIEWGNDSTERRIKIGDGETRYNALPYTSDERALKLAIDSLSRDLAEEAAAREGADATLQGNIDTVAGDLAAEASIRGSADAVLQENIAAAAEDLAEEAAAREGADSTLQGNIDTVAGDLAAEAETRGSADAVLQGNIAAEASIRGSADAALQGNIESEAASRGAADFALANDLATETLNRTNADTALQGHINAEAADRGTADSTLQGNINAEADARGAADISLQGNIDTVAGDLADETTAREGADSTLQGNIDTVSGDLADETAARESYDQQQDRKLETLNGHYYPLEGYDFGKTLDVKTPNTDDAALLTAYAMAMESVSETAQIIDGSVVKNEYDGVEFVWNAANQTWLDWGVGNIVTAGNDHLGVVEGTADPGDGSKDEFITVLPGGRMKTIGFAALKEKAAGKQDAIPAKTGTTAQYLTEPETAGGTPGTTTPYANNVSLSSGIPATIYDTIMFSPDASEIADMKRFLAWTGIVDARTANFNPNEYRALNAKNISGSSRGGIFTEFKIGQSIGVTKGGAENYGLLTTIVPWGDVSGGVIQQIFELKISGCLGYKWERASSGAQESEVWSDWMETSDVWETVPFTYGAGVAATGYGYGAGIWFNWAQKAYRIRINGVVVNTFAVAIKMIEIPNPPMILDVNLGVSIHRFSCFIDVKNSGGAVTVRRAPLDIDVINNTPTTLALNPIPLEGNAVTGAYSDWNNGVIWGDGMVYV
jgi:hypothetical protein